LNRIVYTILGLAIGLIAPFVWPYIGSYLPKVIELILLIGMIALVIVVIHSFVVLLDPKTTLLGRFLMAYVLLTILFFGLLSILSASGVKMPFLYR
jgi:hypothetical protein